MAEVNEAIGPLRTRLHHRPFRKREGRRASLFAALDRPALQPLPGERYRISEWKNVRTNLDYHVESDRHYYSVPYQLTGQLLEARFTATRGEVFPGGGRVASHGRSSAADRHTTNLEHRPKSPQAHWEWTPSRRVHGAASVGPATAQVVEAILSAKPHPEMGYRSCLGILRRAQTYARRAAGSGQPAGVTAPGVFLSKFALDSAELARPPGPAHTGNPALRPPARKRARGRLLRSAALVFAINHSLLKGHPPIAVFR
ncbi:MAG: transposase [Acidobacteriaceae bacterium]|nr:transposase [Acidobacteriaceae bacterium]